MRMKNVYNDAKIHVDGNLRTQCRILDFAYLARYAVV